MQISKQQQKHCFHRSIFYLITLAHFPAHVNCVTISKAWLELLSHFGLILLHIYWAFIKSIFFVQPIWCTMHWFPCGHMRHVINCDICCPMWQTPLESILSCDKRYKQVFQYNPQPGQRLIRTTNISETLLIYGDFGCKSWIPTSLSNTEMRFNQKPSTVVLLPIPGGDVSMSRIIHLHKWCDCWSGSPTYIHVSQGTWQVIHIHERPELFIPYFGDRRSYQIREDLIVIVLI